MHDATITIEDEQVEVLDVDAPCTAEVAECTCPDFCERDHDNE
jgi:hypothetical protein